MRKIYVKVICQVIFQIDDDVPCQDVINEMECQFTVSDEHSGPVDLIDSRIMDFELIDSK